MYLDHEEARANKERREAYDELKKELLTKAAQDDKSSSASKRAYWTNPHRIRWTTRRLRQ